MFKIDNLKGAKSESRSDSSILASNVAAKTTTSPIISTTETPVEATKEVEIISQATVTLATEPPSLAGTPVGDSVSQSSTSAIPAIA